MRLHRVASIPKAQIGGQILTEIRHPAHDSIVQHLLAKDTLGKPIACCVAALAPVVLLISLWLGSTNDVAAGGKVRLWRRLQLPWFIVAFLAVVAVNSLFDIPATMSQWALDGSKAMLLLAVTATAMRSRMDLLMKLGWRAVTPVVTATGVSFLAALAFAYYGVR